MDVVSSGNSLSDNGTQQQASSTQQHAGSTQKSHQPQQVRSQPTKKLVPAPPNPVEGRVGKFPMASAAPVSAAAPISTGTSSSVTAVVLLRQIDAITSSSIVDGQANLMS